MDYVHVRDNNEEMLNEGEGEGQAYEGEENQEEQIRTDNKGPRAEGMNKGSRTFMPKSKKPNRFDLKPREFTHFIAIPVDSKKVCKKLVDLQYKVEEIDAGRSIYEEWYTTEESFHFTLCMLP